MGSIISLGLGRFEIDWGKNEFFRNHSALFLRSDRKDVPYYYANEIVEHKLGYSRKLSGIKRRLELLGYSIPTIREKYEELMEDSSNFYDLPPPNFDTFARAISSIDVRKRGSMTGMATTISVSM